jgi:hypothetical protein
VSERVTTGLRLHQVAAGGQDVHGSSDMPVSGPIFGWLDHYNEVAVQQRIKNLCDYLASLQEKDS